MSVRSLNKVQLIGNLTRDPELRYTPSGTAVCTFGLATNRSWTTQTGEAKEDTEFHRIVSWNKLAEICSQLLVKGRKIYVEGRLSTRTWTAQDNTQRTTTEIVIEDMIILDSRKTVGGYREDAGAAAMSGGQVMSGAPVAASAPATSPTVSVQAVGDDSAKKTRKSSKKAEENKEEEKKDEVVTAAPVSEDINPDDIPF